MLNGPKKIVNTLEKIFSIPREIPLTQLICRISKDMVLHLDFYTYLYKYNSFYTNFFLVCSISHHNRPHLYPDRPHTWGFRIHKPRVWLHDFIGYTHSSCNLFQLLSFSNTHHLKYTSQDSFRPTQALPYHTSPH